MGRKPIILTKSKQVKHCKGCWIYERRKEISEKITEKFDLDGIWSFEVCIIGCWKKEEKNEQKLKEYQNKLYHRKNPKAKYRGKNV
jgi:hypothetical protein